MLYTIGAATYLVVVLLVIQQTKMVWTYVVGEKREDTYENATHENGEKDL